MNHSEIKHRGHIIRTHGALYRLGDVLLAIGAPRSRATHAAKRHIEDEHRIQIGPRKQEAWYVTLEGLEQWRDKSHMLDAVSGALLEDFILAQRHGDEQTVAACDNCFELCPTHTLGVVECYGEEFVMCTACAVSVGALGSRRAAS